MPDTERTLSEILALTPNNTTGETSNADLRDMLVSLAPSLGACDVTTPAATTIAVAGTLVLVAGTTTAAGTLRGMSHATPGRLTYTGAPARRFHVSAEALLSTATAGVAKLSLTLRKNGAAITGLVASVVRVPGTGEPLSVSVSATVDLVTGDYIEAYVTNHTATDAVTAQGLHLSARGDLT